MFKQFLIKKMIQSQMNKVPAEFRPVLTDLIENHPDLLMKLATDFEAERKTGKSDQQAFMAVAEKNKEALAFLKK